eukprot:4065594-Pleurochrysis_carterae.AAC.1
MHSCSVAGGLRRKSPLRGAVPPATYVRGTDHLREQARYPKRQHCISLSSTEAEIITVKTGTPVVGRATGGS